ncbi:zinc finger (CCCH-type) family protein [Tasmannia lanceolata]|uniref:zinc finger (CCCH-type) family protein n=1 Tax=Tasmannia lanceolata TaxID=3420 RepID=UPI0040634472
MAVPEIETQTLQNLTTTPLGEEIQPSTLQSTVNTDSTETLKNENSNPKEESAAEGEESKKNPNNEEIKSSNIQSEESEDSINGGDSISKRKRKKNPEDPMWKTSLCSFFRRQSGSSCSHGDTCQYAHGEGELRPRPDNSWDPTSDRAKKLLKLEIGERIEDPDLGPREDVIPFLNDFSSDGSLDKCLVHLPRKWTSENLKSFLDTQGILYKMAKKKKGMTVGFVCFATSEQVNNAIEELDGKSMGNKRIKVANVIPRPNEQKPRSAVSLGQRNAQVTESCSANEDPAENEDIVDNDNNSVVGLVSRTRSARDVVTPLAHMLYCDQLEHKKSTLSQTLKRLTRNARKACPDAVPLPEWILQSREIGGLPCKLEGILESPLINGYRNKCEFSVGYSLQGKRTVGFMLGNFREGMTAVEEPVDCPNVSRISCKYASIFQEFLQSSDLPVWNRIDNTGFWRQFTVREGRSPCQDAEVDNLEACIAEVMLVVQVCSASVDNELVTSEFRRMTQALAHGASACSPPLPLTALVVQDHKGISNAAPADSPLTSLPIPRVKDISTPEDSKVIEPRIHDYISNLRFSISPTAFFQVNTLAAEKLYSLAGDWAGLGPDTLLFDVCCGTGTIGLTLAHRVGMVVGIEMNDSAVLDAHRNAEINGIKNCRFVCAKAEDVMGTILREYLDVPQKHDEILHLPESNDKENISEGENGTHDDKIHSGDKGILDCSDDISSRNVEATQVPRDGVVLVEPTEGSILNASKLNEGSNHEMANAKSASDCQHNSLGKCEDPSKRNCISEENGTSAIPMQQFKHVVAIVDPPRVGLHPIVLKALRTHPRLRRLVYISCNPESLVANAIELCTPSTDKPEKGKNNKGWRNMSSAGLARHRAKSMPSSEHFQPVRAKAVDLFPHTPHCEMVMLLER